MRYSNVRLLMAFAIFLWSLVQLTAQDLPHLMTKEEAKIWPNYLHSLSSSERVITTPPPYNVRTMAEWEELDALVVTWTSYTSILTQIVGAAVNECDVIIVCSNPTSVNNTLQSAGINTTNVSYVTASFNSVWVRDYGPWTAYKNDVEDRIVVDWIYNRPRPLDDVIPGVIAGVIGDDHYGAIASPWNLIHTGGNNLTDGLGTFFSSDLILNENPTKTESDINNIMTDFLGMVQHPKFDVLPNDGIHHVDMHMKILDEETIMFGEYPSGISDGPQIETNINTFLNNYQTPFGNEYKIVRIPQPPEGGAYPGSGGDYRTYTNSIAINGTILVPTYETQFDNVALDKYEELYPGYNIVGINCGSIITALGALHCITKTIGVADPLLIAASRLRNTSSTSARTVTSIIKHASGIASANLFYKNESDASYQSVAMTLTIPSTNTWAADVPGYPEGTRVQYYVQATSISGKVQERPLIAPTSYYYYDITPSDPFGNCTVVASLPHHESFEGTLGDWTQSTADNINWLTWSGATPTASTGATIAQEGPYYLYIESTSPNSPNKTAIITSPCFNLENIVDAEVVFKYHMYGSNMGSLALQASSDGTNWTPIWTKTGNQGDSWLSATVDLSAYDGGGLKLRFFGTTGSGGLSDICIDNVRVQSGGTGITPVKSEKGVITNASNNWQTITLQNTYVSPVVIATAYLPSSTSTGRVARVRNAAGNTFELKVQNPSGTAISGASVHYLVVEAGVYTEAVNGIKMEAVRVTSTLTAENNNWALETRTYANTYTSPVVLGQVMTENDTKWSVFWASNSSRTSPPSATSFRAGKHVGEDPVATRANETIGYVVLETGNGTMGSLSFYAAVGSDIVRGPNNSSTGYTYNFSGVTSATVALLSSAAMDDSNGGWPCLYTATPISAASIKVIVDEDQTLDSERSHTTEQLAYLVFGTGPQGLGGLPNDEDFALPDIEKILAKPSIEGIGLGAIHIYPNPTMENLSVNYQFDGSQREGVLVKLVDMRGQVVYTQKFDKWYLGDQQELNLENIQDGLYLIILHDGNNYFTSRFIKRRR